MQVSRPNQAPVIGALPDRQVVTGKVQQCTDPIGYGIEATTTLASGASHAFMCASPDAAECVKGVGAEVDIRGVHDAQRLAIRH